MAIDINGYKPPQNQATTGRSSAKSSSSSDSASSQSSSASVDTVSLTETTSKLSQSIADAPVSNSERVAVVQKAVAEGTYEINPLRVAEKMLNFERTLNR